MTTPTADHPRIHRIGISVLAVACLAAGLAAAGEENADTEPAVIAKAGEDRIEWHPQIAVEKTMLTVWGEGRLIDRDFDSRTVPGFDLEDRRGKPLPDGDYEYRLTVVPELAGADRERLADLRAAVDADAGSAAPFVLAGTFTVGGGVLAGHELSPKRLPHERPLAPSAKAGGDLSLGGDLTARGTVSLVVLDPDDGRRSLHYAALSGPEVGTYYRGTAKLDRGEAVIELPSHFAELTEERGITVQLTPVGAWSRLYVAEKSPGRLVVRQAEGDGEATFDFLVQGVRSGHAGFRVERPTDRRWGFPEPR